jgi:excisionase family DNA binding protein
MVTVEDVMAAAKVSRSTIILAIEAGRLPAYKPGGGRQWRIEVADATAWLKSRCIAHDTAAELDPVPS